MTENEICTEVIGKALEIHSALGPGLLESAYQHCLSYELHNLGFLVEEEKSMPLVFKEIKLDCGYRIDLLIESNERRH